MARKTTRQGLKAAKKGKAAAVKKPKERTKADQKAMHGDVKPLSAGRNRGSLPPFPRRQPDAEGRAAAHQSLHAAGRGGSVRAGDRCRRQQGNARFVRGRRHAGENGQARRGQGARFREDHRALSRQGEEHHLIVENADRSSTTAKCRARARRWKRCPASGARPRMSCSILRSVSRPSRSTRMCFASATARVWRSGKIRSRSRRGSVEVIPEKYMLHAHHWLILHGRYTCLARKPLCEKCIIADICHWPGKTVAA